jgi:hypothetical protein
MRLEHLKRPPRAPSHHRHTTTYHHESFMTDYLFKYTGYLTITAADSDTALERAAEDLPDTADLELYDELPHLEDGR